MLTFLSFPTDEFLSLDYNLVRDFNDSERAVLKRVFCGLYIHHGVIEIKITEEFAQALKHTLGKGMPHLYNGFSLERINNYIIGRQYYLALSSNGSGHNYCIVTRRYSSYYQTRKESVKRIIDEIHQPFFQNWRQLVDAAVH